MSDRQAYEAKLQPLVGAMNEMLQGILMFLRVTANDPELTDENKAFAHLFMAGTLRDQADAIMDVAKVLPGFSAATALITKQATEGAN